jgi:phage-related minor tail protein
MLAESLMALAAAGGAAVAQAAGTDAWAGLRSRIAAWFGRGNERRERVELERLDRSARELTEHGAGSEDVRSRHETVWQTRIADFLEELPDEERDEAAAALRAVLKEVAAPGAVSAGAGGAAAGRDINIEADRGSFAAGTANIEGGVRLGNPPHPGPEKA